MMALIVIILCLIAPFISPYGALEFSDDVLVPPCRNHYLGTDEYGRDLFARILLGGRITLTIAVIPLCLATAFGTSWGLLAAYAKGIVGTMLNRFIDVLMSFPAIMVALFVLAIFGTGGKAPLIIAIAITLCPRYARIIRGSTLPILEEDFILAAQALGARQLSIFLRHVLPNLTAPITVLTSIYLPYIIILESSLSFLGLGAPPEISTWGLIIADGKAYMRVAPWLTVFPGIAIIFTGISFNLLGDGLRDVFDPRSMLNGNIRKKV
jgi:peptide/nickel transport system permease protein